MLSALFAFAAVLGLWNLNMFLKRRQVGSKFAKATRFEINEVLYGYVTTEDFVLILSSTLNELFRFPRKNLQRVEIGSNEDRLERKSAEVVVLEWTKDDGTTKLFKLDLSDPKGKDKAATLIEVLTRMRIT